MSKPYEATGQIEDFEALDGELMEARSCLFTTPHPLSEEERDGCTSEYLADTDYYVRHSLEHLSSLRECYRTAEKIMEAIRKLAANGITDSNYNAEETPLQALVAARKALSGIRVLLMPKEDLSKIQRMCGEKYYENEPYDHGFGETHEGWLDHQAELSAQQDSNISALRIGLERQNKITQELIEQLKQKEK